MSTAIGFSLTNVVESFSQSVQEKTAQIKFWVQSKSYSYLDYQAKVDNNLFAKIDEKVKNLILQPGTDIQEGSASYQRQFKNLQKKAHGQVERNLKAAAQREIYLDPFKGVDNSLLSRTLNKKIAAYQAEQGRLVQLTLQSADIEYLYGTVLEKAENIESLIHVLEEFSNPALEELLESSIFDLRESLAQLEALQQEMESGKKEKAPLVKAYASSVRKQASEALEQAQNAVKNLKETLKTANLDAFALSQQKAQEIYARTIPLIGKTKEVQDELTNISNPNYVLPGDEAFNEKRVIFDANKEALEKELKKLEQLQKSVEGAFKRYDTLLSEEVQAKRKGTVAAIQNLVGKIKKEGILGIERAEKEIKEQVVSHTFSQAYCEIASLDLAFRESLEKGKPDLAMLKELEQKTALYLKNITNPQSRNPSERQYISRNQKDISHAKEIIAFLKEFAKTSPASNEGHAKTEEKRHSRVSSDAIKQALSASVPPRFHRMAASVDGIAVPAMKEKIHRRVQTIGEEAKIELAVYANRVEVR